MAKRQPFPDICSIRTDRLRTLSKAQLTQAYDNVIGRTLGRKPRPAHSMLLIGYLSSLLWVKAQSPGADAATRRITARKARRADQLEQKIIALQAKGCKR